MATETPIGILNQTGAQTVGADTVAVTPLATGVVAYRQTITLGDPTNAGSFATVDPVAGLSVYEGQDTRLLLTAILDTLRDIQVLLGGLPRAGTTWEFN